MDYDRAKLFASKDLTEKTINALGMTFPVYVRRLPTIDLRRYHAEVLAPDISTRAKAGFDALHKSIRNADGSPFASVDEFARMDADVISEFTEAFTEVNKKNLDAELGNA